MTSFAEDIQRFAAAFVGLQDERHAAERRGAGLARRDDEEWQRHFEEEQRRAVLVEPGKVK